MIKSFFKYVFIGTNAFIFVIINGIYDFGAFIGNLFLKFIDKFICLIDKLFNKLFKKEAKGLKKAFNNYTFRMTFTSIVFVIGLIMATVYSCNIVFAEKQKEASLDLFFKDMVVLEETNELEEKNNPQEEIKDTIIKNYLAVIQIDKIDLFQGITVYNSQTKNMDKHVTYLPQSNLPDEKNSNFVLAAHSGAAKTAYFNNIDKLIDRDEIIIYYKNQIYYYTVYKIFTVSETDISILDAESKRIITLITCKKNDNTKRLIIKARLSKVENY